MEDDMNLTLWESSDKGQMAGDMIFNKERRVGGVGYGF